MRDWNHDLRLLEGGDFWSIIEHAFTCSRCGRIATIIQTSRLYICIAKTVLMLVLFQLGLWHCRYIDQTPGKFTR